MARRLHPRTCFRGYRQPASVPERSCYPRGVLRVGWVQWRARHAYGHQYVVLPRPRRTGTGSGIHLAGPRYGADPGVGHARRVARAAEDFIPEGEAVMTGRIFSVVGAMFVLTVCSKGSQSNAAPAAPPPAPPAPAAAPDVAVAGGTITGKIKFTGTAPRNPAIDMSEEAACKAKYTTTPTEENVVAGAAHAPANRFVDVKGGLPAGHEIPPPPAPRAVGEKHCAPPPPPPPAIWGGETADQKILT